MSAAPILDLIEAFRRSKTMFTAVRLGVFNELAGGPLDAPTIASRLQLDPQACSRLLNGCVALGLVERDKELYRNSGSAARYLTNDSPDTLADYVMYSDASLYPLWGQLEHAVREGGNRWEQVFGSRTALFDHYFRDPAATRAFLGGMHGFGQLASPLIVSAFDLSRYRHLVDLGGATGHLSIAACRAYPDLQATVVDLAKVESIAREVIDGSPVRDRITFAVRDFFADELVAGDLYYLGRILHDWSDDKTGPLLEKIHRALPEGGALLVGETLVNEDRSGPVYSLMQDLNMLVCTDGRERTRSEYKALLQTAGFSSVSFCETGSLIDAIFAVK